LAPEPGTHSGEQLGETEGFGDVVVGTRVEADDDVDLVAAGRDDDDVQLRVAAAQLAAHVDAVDVGQPQVEQDEVGRRTGQAEGIAAGLRPADGRAVPGERLYEGAADGLVVFDDEEGCAVHAPILRVPGG